MLVNTQKKVSTFCQFRICYPQKQLFKYFQIIQFYYFCRHKKSCTKKLSFGLSYEQKFI